MKKLLLIMRMPEGAPERCRLGHHIWMALALTAMGCGIGLLSLLFSAFAIESLENKAMFLSYLSDPMVLLFNLWPCVLLVWLFYFLFRRAWVGFLGGYLPVIILALVNYFKIRLRGDPLLAVDLSLASEAVGIVGGYQLDLTWVVWFALGCLVAGLLVSILLMPNGMRGWRERGFGALSVLGLLGVSFVGIYINPYFYDRMGSSDLINPWNSTEVYISRGGTCSFLHSFRDMMYIKPEGYDEQKARELLSQYEDTDIPEEEKVSVLGIMLEAYCDLTQLDVLSEQESIWEVYAPWHKLEEQSVSGRLLTNIFAGGTVDTEWGFLTGYSNHSDFVRDTDSYVWYLANQGYQTFGSHPGFSWFYDRQNVNPSLGFQDYWFTENYYGELVDPVAAQWNSDHILNEELLKQLKERVKQGPAFSFSVSYQNHGPYETERTLDQAYLAPEGTGLSQQTCNIWNNYLMRVSDTLDALTQLVEGVEAMEEPVVMVFFGDHKPWGGNGNTAYTELGLTFDLSTPEGFYDYYSTPYIICANSAAKEVLGRDFVGEGGDFSPCFLMAELFDQCGWEGPGFMQLAREVREITPLIHKMGIYYMEKTADPAAMERNQQFVQDYLCAEYYREHEIRPQHPEQ